MLSISLRLHVGKVRTEAEKTIKLALLLETDVLLSLGAAAACLLLKFGAPSNSFWGRLLLFSNWAYLYLAVSASWAIAGRFVTEHQGSVARRSATLVILAPAALGPPAMTALILPFTFPQYSRGCAAMHFASCLIPAFFIALFGRSATPDEHLATPSPRFLNIPLSSPPLAYARPLLRHALSFRSTKPLPLRVALLRGTRFPKKPTVHPLIKKHQFRPTSPLKVEAIEGPRMAPSAEEMMSWA